MGGNDASGWCHAILGEEIWQWGDPRGCQYMNVNWIGPASMRYGSDAPEAPPLPRPRPPRRRTAPSTTATLSGEPWGRVELSREAELGSAGHWDVERGGPQALVEGERYREHREDLNAECSFQLLGPRVAHRSCVFVTPARRPRNERLAVIL